VSAKLDKSAAENSGRLPAGKADDSKRGDAGGVADFLTRGVGAEVAGG
jgi:hypothetical protein